MHASQKCMKWHLFVALLLKAAIKLCAADQLPHLGKLLKDLSNLIPARKTYTACKPSSCLSCSGFNFLVYARFHFYADAFLNSVPQFTVYNPRICQMKGSVTHCSNLSRALSGSVASLWELLQHHPCIHDMLACLQGIKEGCLLQRTRKLRSNCSWGSGRDRRNARRLIGSVIREEGLTYLQNWLSPSSDRTRTATGGAATKTAAWRCCR